MCGGGGKKEPRVPQARPAKKPKKTHFRAAIPPGAQPHNNPYARAAIPPNAQINNNAYPRAAIPRPTAQPKPPIRPQNPRVRPPPRERPTPHGNENTEQQNGDNGYYEKMDVDIFQRACKHLNSAIKEWNFAIKEHWDFAIMGRGATVLYGTEAPSCALEIVISTNASPGDITKCLLNYKPVDTWVWEDGHLWYTSDSKRYKLNWEYPLNGYGWVSGIEKLGPNNDIPTLSAHHLLDMTCCFWNHVRKKIDGKAATDELADLIRFLLQRYPPQTKKGEIIYTVDNTFITKFNQRHGDRRELWSRAGLPNKP